MPPLLLMALKYSLAPSVVSRTVAATVPVCPAVWPMRIWAWAKPAKASQTNTAVVRRHFSDMVKPFITFDETNCDDLCLLLSPFNPEAG